jgi:hypothetical protein
MHNKPIATVHTGAFMMDPRGGGGGGGGEGRGGGEDRGEKGGGEKEEEKHESNMKKISGETTVGKGNRKE